MPHLLGSPVGRRVAAVQLTSSLAQMTGSFVLPFVVLERTGKAPLSAIVAALIFAGLALFSVPLSSAIDRVPRLPALRVSLLFLLLSAAGFWGLVAFTEGVWAVWPLLGLQVSIAVCAALASFTCNSIVKLSLPQEEMVSAGAFMTGIRQVSWFGGQALAALAAGFLGSGWAAFLAVFFSLLSLIATLGLPQLSLPSHQHLPMFKGLSRLWRVPGLPSVTALGVFWNLLVAPVFVSQVAFLYEVSGFQSGRMGIVFAAGAAGSLVAVFWLHRLCARSRPGSAIAPLLLMWSVAAFLYIYFSDYPAAGWAFLMIANTALAGLFSGLRNDLVPHALMALGSSASVVSHLAFFSLGGVLGGLLLHFISLTQLNLLSASSLLLLIGPAWLITRRLLA